MTVGVESRMAGALLARKVGPDQIVYTRRLRGPRELVFAALTEPHMVMQWMRSRDQPITACEGEACVGGQTVHLWQSGTQPTRLTLRWLEVTAPTRLVSWQVFSQWPEGRAHSVVTLAPARAQTLYTAVKTYAQSEIRDAVFSTPMPDHMEQAFVGLDARLTHGFDRVSAPNHHAASPDD